MVYHLVVTIEETTNQKESVNKVLQAAAINVVPDRILT